MLNQQGFKVVKEARCQLILFLMQPASNVSKTVLLRGGMSTGLSDKTLDL